LENRTKAERMVECEERKEMEEMKESRFKRICVFCGSSPGNKTSYKDAAIELGNELVISLSLTHTQTFFLFLKHNIVSKCPLSHTSKLWLRLRCELEVVIKSADVATNMHTILLLRLIKYLYCDHN
jgi:hypothetical protein